MGGVGPQVVLQGNPTANACLGLCPGFTSVQIAALPELAHQSSLRDGKTKVMRFVLLRIWIADCRNGRGIYGAKIPDDLLRCWNSAELLKISNNSCLSSKFQ